MKSLIQTFFSKTRATQGILTIGMMMIAQTAFAAKNGQYNSPTSSIELETILAALTSTIVRVAVPFLVIAVVWIGFLFASARGNEEKLSEAKRALMWTIAGTAIIAGAYIVIDLILSVSS